MRFQAKTAAAFLALLLGGALICTPALAQRKRSNNPPPPPPPQSDWAAAGQGQPAPPPPGGSGRQVWVAQGQGRGWAAWRRRGNEIGGGLGVGAGFGDLATRGSQLLGQAQRVLRNPQVRQALGFSEQQANKLDQEVTDFRKTLIQDRANLEIQRIDMENSLAAQNPDKSAVDNQLQQLNAAQFALEKSAVDFYLTLKQEITPGQQQKIRQYLRRWQGGDFGVVRRSGSDRGRRNGHRRDRRTYQGSQPPNGNTRQRDEQQQSAPEQNSQGEPQGSTSQTNNQ